MQCLAWTISQGMRQSTAAHPRRLGRKAKDSPREIENEIVLATTSCYGVVGSGLNDKKGDADEILERFSA